MSDTLYLQIDENILVSHTHVSLQDIAELSCSNTKLLNRLRALPIANLSSKKPGRYVYTVTQIIEEIQKAEPSLSITALGEPTFLLTYAPSGRSNPLFGIGKTALVCLLSFFGAAFSIMTFHNDTDVPKIFSQIYQQVTGQTSNGFTVLEISYSIGIGIGVLFFFNHFGRMKLTSDPSPMQVQMRQYEDQVNTTIMEETEREYPQNKTN